MAKGSNEIKKLVNSRSNKSDLQSALNEAIKSLRELESNEFNPVEVKTSSKNGKIIEEAEKITNVKENVELDKINAAKKMIENIITVMTIEHNKATEAFENNKEKFNSVNEAIKIKEQQLKDLFGIEDVLIKLSDLISYYNNKDVELDELYRNKQIELESQHRKAIEDSRKKLEELKVEYDRKSDEFDYSFSRKKLKDTNDFKDYLKNLQKEFDEKNLTEQKLVDDRFESLKKEQDEFRKEKNSVEELEEEINKLKETLETVETRAKEDGKASAKKSFNYELMIVKKDYEAKIEVLNNKLESSKDTIENYRIEIEDLKIRLKEAYSEMKEIANKSMETSSNKQYTSSIERTLNTLSNNQKESK